MVGNCGDCIHFEVCSVWNKKFIALRIKRQSVCEHFKNKADFVEVVRCKDCRNRIEKNWAKCAGRKPDDFCSDGIRRS